MCVYCLPIVRQCLASNEFKYKKCTRNHVAESWQRWQSRQRQVDNPVVHLVSGIFSNCNNPMRFFVYRSMKTGRDNMSIYPGWSRDLSTVQLQSCNLQIPPSLVVFSNRLLARTNLHFYKPGYQAICPAKNVQCL